MKILAKQKESKAFVVNGTETVRMKFTKARKFLNPVNYIVQMGYKSRKNRKTPIGRAMSAILQSAMIGTYPNIEVDPAKAKLSAGMKSALKVYSLERKGADIALSWNPVTDKVKRNEWDDGIILCAYAIAHELAAINEEAALRYDGKLQLRLPEGMEELPVHLYLIVHDRDKANFSDSQYLGLFA
ncbi:DUF6266 family protein [Sphingobacterium sp. BIGb0165]|uniref:DUF6266 family protein n=1 Tax=Sphingobacterium sp. BIGb0165 TaxID=2940615 RepID=UPI00216A4EE5|nr:DUF6266 family protein [Sphingobacterium sp. BIGb0165]MCS4226436.1 hypothetical protein [Sphingobacterium sp. BIGb0165]